MFSLAWSALPHSFYAHRGTSDAEQYQTWAAEVRQGEVPYRDFSFPYPPGALIVVAAPIATGTVADQSAYVHWFGRLMWALGVCCLLIAVWLRAWRAVAVFVAVPLAVGGLVATRFDLWPATLTLAAVACLIRDRGRLGWALLGAAVAAKLYPLVLVPLAIVWTFRRQGRAELVRCAAIGAAVAAAMFLPFLVVAPRGLWDSVYGQVSRPLEVESLAASFLKTIGHPQTVGGPWGLAVSGHGAWGVLSALVGIAVLACLWLRFAKGAVDDSDRLVRYSAACVAAFIAFGKVLSPQYSIWLVVLVPLVRGRRGLTATLLLAGVLFATDYIWYGASRFDDYAFASSWAWLELLRNLGFVALVALLVLPVPGAARAPAAVREPRVVPGEL